MSRHPVDFSRYRLARFSTLGLALLLTLVALLDPMGATAHPPRSGPNVAAIDAFVETQMDRHRIQGLALAITQGDEIVHVQGYGTAGEGRPVRADTPFYIGSVTKSFTALAVMQLVEEGKIELDRSVQDYLPWFEVADPDASAQITVRHLLNQTSGLSRASYADVPFSSGASMEKAVKALASARPTAPVGTEFQYFNQNYTTLGLLIEAVSGQTYGEYLATNVFGPLRMERSFTSRTAAVGAGLAQGYNVLFGLPVPCTQPHLTYDLPAGFIISTAEDMSHYLIAQLNEGLYEGRRLISPAGLAEMHRPPDGVGGAYAMGWGVEEQDGRRLIRHDGTLETFYASVLLLPDQGYGVALLANQVSFPHMALAYKDIVQGVVGRLVGPEPDPGISTATVYLIVSVIAIGALALQVRSLLRLGRWREQIQDRGSTRRVLGTLWKLIFGIFVLLILPWVLIQNAGLTATKVSLLNYLPDVTIWLGLMAALSLVEGVLRAWRLLRAPRGKKVEYA
ncbi:MAG: serine hydrolase domain-containing protein [Anaerolineae bacterium]